MWNWRKFEVCSETLSTVISFERKAETMRIAITGGTGFIGGHLARRLVGEGHEVIGIARRPRESRGQPGIRFVPSDLADEASLAAAFAGGDAVAHCAGINRELGKQIDE